MVRNFDSFRHYFFQWFCIKQKAENSKMLASPNAAAVTKLVLRIPGPQRGAQVMGTVSPTDGMDGASNVCRASFWLTGFQGGKF